MEKEGRNEGRDETASERKEKWEPEENRRKIWRQNKQTQTRTQNGVKKGSVEENEECEVSTGGAREGNRRKM